MSETLNRKNFILRRTPAMTEQQTPDREKACEVRIDTHQVAINLIQSGAFDADPTEVQRLRDVLDGIRQYLMLISNKTVSEQRTIEICNEALSTATEPTGAERVRERYKNAEHLNATTSGATAEYYLGVMNGITDTLNDFGITITGINAQKGDGNDA